MIANKGAFQTAMSLVRHKGSVDANAGGLMNLDVRLIKVNGCRHIRNTYLCWFK